MSKAKGMPFRYYVKDGVCKPDTEMPENGEEYAGWKSANHVLKNEYMHTVEDFEAAQEAYAKWSEGMPSE